MKLFKKLLVDSAKRVENSKLAAETWGNLSVRDPKSGYIFLTPGGIKHCDITEDDIVAPFHMPESLQPAVVILYKGRIGLLAVGQDIVGERYRQRRLRNPRPVGKLAYEEMVTGKKGTLHRG